MMARAFLFSLVALAACTREQPPAPELQPDVYPLEVGYRWEYRSEIGLKVVREVKRTVRENGKEWYEMTFTLPLVGDHSLLMHRDTEGILARRKKREQRIMRFPLKPGETWTIDFPGEDLAVCTVEEPEELEILDKKISCSRVRVERKNRKSGRMNRDFEWYAEGIGLVKMTVTMMKVTQTFTLHSFTTPENSP